MPAKDEGFEHKQKAKATRPSISPNALRTHVSQENISNGIIIEARLEAKYEMCFQCSGGGGESQLFSSASLSSEITLAGCRVSKLLRQAAPSRSSLL